uniref:Uncharacterized protein n=1 Tax=Timema cristinae TaxID=61476 RepID=A0A7R9CBW8_TIMCR|nr:unnamed protein product [Timema cristinae]
MQNPDAQAKALIGQESVPKPPPPPKDHTCKQQFILGENRSCRRRTIYATYSMIVGIADRSCSPSSSRTGLQVRFNCTIFRGLTFFQIRLETPGTNPHENQEKKQRPYQLHHTAHLKCDSNL